MTERKLSIEDYPLAEKRPEIVAGRRGKKLSDLTLENVISGAVTLDDLTITQGALNQQAEISHAAGRPTLAANFMRAGEIVDVPQDVIMQTYELLRPGRARSKVELIAAADQLLERYGAARMAAFVAEAAEVYERRGLFRKRY